MPGIPRVPQFRESSVAKDVDKLVGGMPRHPLESGRTDWQGYRKWLEEKYFDEREEVGEEEWLGLIGRKYRELEEYGMYREFVNEGWEEDFERYEERFDEEYEKEYVARYGHSPAEFKEEERIRRDEWEKQHEQRAERKRKQEEFEKNAEEYERERRAKLGLDDPEKWG